MSGTDIKNSGNTCCTVVHMILDLFFNNLFFDLAYLIQ